VTICDCWWCEERDHDDDTYDESCVCCDCRIERGRRLSVLMFGWMVRA
jgi:hypothetical protein